MLKKILPTLFLLLSLGLLSHFLDPQFRSFVGKEPGYKQLWKRVDSCERYGLSESALKIVDQVYQKAKKENNAAQLVKAVIHRMKFKQYKEEFALEKNIADLESEVKNSVFPARAVLQSLLAEAYWNYYETNRWKFYNRSATLNFRKDDVSTYSLNDLVDACVRYYKASLNEAALAKGTRIDVMDEVVLKGSPVTRTWRPTLYDFLAHRALDFFKNSEADLSHPANQFAFDKEDFLKPFPAFLTMDLQKSADSLDFRYHTALLFRDLESFHARDSDHEALADLELERFSYMYNNVKTARKDSVYLSALAWLSNHFKNTSRAAEFEFMKAEWEFQNAKDYRPFQDSSKKWGRKKARDICLYILKMYPKSRGTSLARNLLQDLQSQSLSLVCEKVNEAGKNCRVYVQYKNTGKVYFKLLAVKDYLEYQVICARHYGKDLYKRLLDLPLVKEQVESLKDDHDLNTHSTEIRLVSPDYGYYVLLASLNKDFDLKDNILSSQLFVVSDMALLEQRKQNQLNDLYVLNRQNGQPIKAVKAQLWFYEYDRNGRNPKWVKGKTFESNQEGLISMQVQETLHRNYLVELRNDKDLFYTNDYFSNQYQEQTDYPQISSFIFTDRAIYRPGQTLYFKSIVFRGAQNKYEVQAGQKIRMSFYDVNHQLISEQELVSNEYGTVFGAFSIPQGVLNGRMSISDGIRTQYISVEEYKRPKFETFIDTIRGEFSLYDTVRLKGIAKAYSGYPIDGAEVRYRVTRSVHYPIWYYWYKPSFSKGSAVEIAQGKTKTNSEGEYTLNFRALPDPHDEPDDSPVYTYQIEADVTDLNGETRSAVTLFKAGYNSLELELETPEQWQVNESPFISIKTKNLNGTDVNAGGTFNVYLLESPQKIFRKRLWNRPDRPNYSKEAYYDMFPDDQYEDELNPHSWKKIKKVISKNFTSGESTDALKRELKNLGPGAYLAEALCKDKKGMDVKGLSYVTVYDAGKSKMPYPMAQWGFALNSTAEPGENASIVVASSYSSVHCIMSVQDGESERVMPFEPSLKPYAFQVTEAQRGGISINSYFVYRSRLYTGHYFITVPFTNKALDITYATFRNKLEPGQKETWSLVIKDKKAEQVHAEILAGMYDASLDAFTEHSWQETLYHGRYYRNSWKNQVEDLSNGQVNYGFSQEYLSPEIFLYDQLNYFGLGFYSGYSNNLQEISISSKNKRGLAVRSSKGTDRNDAVEYESFSPSFAQSVSGSKLSGELSARKAEQKNTGQSLGSIQSRKNLQETAFFFPDLRTNEKGEVMIQFTAPESLTRWKFMGFAHSKDMRFVYSENECVTRKELMVTPNLPRFFREGDEMYIAAKLTNIAQEDVFAQAELHLYDAFTERELSGEWMASREMLKEVWVKPSASQALSWKVKVPDHAQAVKVKIIARSERFSDGEETVIPVLSNRMLVTESMPFSIRGKQNKTFSFTKFINQNNHSGTLKNHAYTIECSANPVWYAVQSLPYLMEYPYECAEQSFARYYANSLARHVVNSKPQIAKVFEAWKASKSDAFLSNLEKNPELKALLLQETPWLLDAREESENKKRIALLFDLNTMSRQLNSALTKLQQLQNTGGAWPWFKGGQDDWYISQHILSGLGKLRKLGVIQKEHDAQLAEMSRKALAYCDRKIREYFEEQKKYYPHYLSEERIDHMAAQYLYMRSFYTEHEIPAASREAFQFYKAQCTKNWLKSERFTQGMIALCLHRLKDNKTPAAILRSLKENALYSEEMGMYWKENYAYYWYQAPVESQALMIEAFDEISGDQKTVDELRVWLLKSKQTQNWPSTKATTEAVYALLLHGSDWLQSEPDLSIEAGNILMDPAIDKNLGEEMAGTGYFKKTFTGAAIQTDMGQIKVSKRGEGLAWGSVYWQYFEQLDKITSHETPLQLNKKIFVQNISFSGPVLSPVTETTALKPGDKLMVRIELRVDRDMEYVHLKDMRAAALEPLNVLSTYKYQDGLAYYESTADAATHFFISNLHKGSYVFEYPLVVSQSGEFSNGISSIHCLYAPEFTSHSEGIRIKVLKP
ncbi:MAG TPA: alpha-2-macroglobulin family protein [Bacteroidia bacterium]|nr:alpha-2-macroglobulin family protein [Bacteroidia bacterium]